MHLSDRSAIHYIRIWQLIGACVFFLSACEAPLKLEGVEQRLTEPIRRSDQFQAATRNTETIAVVGNQGLILLSNDDGHNWQRIKLTGWPTLIDVTTCPDGMFAALAVEGQVWISKDNGNQWLPQKIDTEEAAQAITCDPKNRLWIVGSFSTILSSNNKGQSWDYQSLDEDTILTNIQFLDEQNAYISGEFGTVLKSTDGGASWEVLDPLENDFYPQSMYFLNQDTGWVIGLVGEILQTTDAGNHWVAQKTQTIAPLYGIKKVADTMYVVGGEGIILKLENNQWQRVEHGKPIHLYLRAILAINESQLLVAGNQGSLYVIPVDAL